MISALVCRNFIILEIDHVSSEQQNQRIHQRVAVIKRGTCKFKNMFKTRPVLELSFSSSQPDE